MSPSRESRTPDEADADGGGFVVDDRKARRFGAIIWPSFFAAGVATMVFFAKVDPIDLQEITWVDLEISREAGYTLGFLMFWAATGASSLFTWLLLHWPRSKKRGALDAEDAP